MVVPFGKGMCEPVGQEHTNQHQEGIAKESSGRVLPPQSLMSVYLWNRAEDSSPGKNQHNSVSRGSHNCVVSSPESWKRIAVPPVQKVGGSLCSVGEGFRQKTHPRTN